MRKSHQLIIGTLLCSIPVFAVACSSDDPGSTGNNGGEGGAKATGGSTSENPSTGGKTSQGEGGDGGGELPATAPFTLDDCNATQGPGAAVKNSKVGAFKTDATWMDGWTNWSSSSNKAGLTIPPTKVTLTGALADADLNWTKDKTYVLDGYVWVPSGKTLTIQAGTVIQGLDPAASSGNESGTLFVSMGAKINAVGTAEEPIVFTSAKANGSKKPADWGGVVLLGKAKVRQNSLSYEGLDGTTYPFARFGGGWGGTDVNDDNSGEMKYVRIEFGGAVLQSNKEINGLTFAGVGSGTKISYIQVNTNADDCFEWFGGTVNVDHLVCNNSGDDQVDADDSYQGTIDTVFARGTLNSSTDPNGLEWDGVTDYANANPPETVATTVTLRHATLCGNDGNFGVPSYGAILRRGIKGSLDDVFFLGWDATIDTRDNFELDGAGKPNMTIANSASYQAFDGPGYPETGACSGGDANTCDDDSGFDEAAWFLAGAGDVDWDK